MRRFHLEREGPEDVPRYHPIHTHEENVEPTWEAGVWRVSCVTTTCRDALMRRYGFRLVEDEDVVDTAARERRKAHARSVCVEPEGDVAGLDVWRAWLAARDEEIAPRRDRPRAVEVLRAPSESLPTIEPVSGPIAVSIVLVVTGWGEHETGATLACLACAVELGAKAGVVLIQNDVEAHAATKAWEPPPAVRKRLRRLCVGNEGFAAACRAGAAAVPKGATWLLFTQADARFEAGAVRQAVALATQDVWARPPLVGPSGGFVDLEAGVVQEWGRNAQVPPPESDGPARVDFVAGYWVLVAAEVYRDSGGWDDGYFLYHEDPDLAFRCAAVGARSIAWPGLEVDHARGGTIRPRFARVVIEQIQRWSRERFLALWGVS